MPVAKSRAPSSRRPPIVSSTLADGVKSTDFSGHWARPRGVQAVVEPVNLSSRAVPFKFPVPPRDYVESLSSPANESQSACASARQRARPRTGRTVACRRAQARASARLSSLRVRRPLRKMEDLCDRLCSAPIEMRDLPVIFPAISSCAARARPF